MERRVRVLRIGCVLRRVVVHSEMKNMLFVPVLCNDVRMIKKSDGHIEIIRHHADKISKNYKRIILGTIQA